MPTPHYGQPRYLAIAAELRERIENGIMPPGSLLPAESALAAEFRVARGTIRKAIDVLREDGYAATEHGRGTYATGSSYDHSGNREARQQEVPADARMAALFEVAVGTPLIERETVIRRYQQVESVVRAYRLGTAEA
ncbi:GntR family transcriptional regulator [Micromonospora sp. DT233]|uniref:GntR family transcriptional regulator n=1 Tax=Micromonospora sp. DT233 TaxID=3393432 RepID=UPI003CEBEA7E